MQTKKDKTIKRYDIFSRRGKIKKIIIFYFPKYFTFFKKIYHLTPFYKIIENRQKFVNKKIEAKQTEDNLLIMKTVFNNEYVVQNGNFKGMKYIQKSSGSSFLPKILGSYEEPIQCWVNDIIKNKKYNNILDIGCAEGYYSCGFAMKMPDVNIVAYDIDDVARKNSLELKELNNLKNIEIKTECTHEELNLKSEKGTLIFCDIEGFEDFLLDPIKVPNLKNVDLLVELHDCLIPGITEKIIGRFYLSHRIKIIVDYPFRIKKYNTPIECGEEQMNIIVNENRPNFMKFIYMKSINS